MNKSPARLYGMQIHVGSATGTKIGIITDSKRPYITMSRQVYDFLMIAGGKEHGWSSDEIDDQLTRPRDDLFKSLANQKFYFRLIDIVRNLRTNMLLSVSKIS